MATQDTSTIANTQQTYFSKKLLDYAKQLLRLNEYAIEAELPRNAGTRTIRFFRPSEASAANVKTLTEGTPITQFSNRTFTPVEATLAQIGDAAKITDVVTMTGLFDMLKQNVEGFGGDCALKSDEISRNALAAETTGLLIRRAAGAATWTALNSDTTTSFATATDLVDARTALVRNRAMQVDGAYVAVTPPEVTRDLMKLSLIHI